MIDLFVALIKDVVAARDRHGLQFVDASESPWRTTAFFRNATTRVEFQWEDAMHVLLARLRNGRIPRPPLEITQSTPSDSHYLELLLEHRAPEVDLPMLEMLDSRDPSEFTAGLESTVGAM